MSITEQSLVTIQPEPIAIQSPIARWHQFLDLEVKSGQIAKDTATTYKIGVRKFQQWAESRYAIGADVENTAIKQWIADLRESGVNVKSISVWLSGLRAMFGWLVSEKLVASDPTTGIKAGRGSDSRRHKRDSLTDEEVVRLLNLASLKNRDRALICLMLYTGARTVEIHRIQIEDIRTERGETVVYVQGKGRDTADREPLLVAGRPARDALRDYLTELASQGHTKGPLFATERKYGGARRAISRVLIRKTVKQAFEKAGIVSPLKTTHSIRHTAITKVLQNGGSIRQAQLMARHGTSATTEIYAHEIDRIQNAGERLIEYGENQGE